MKISELNEHQKGHLAWLLDHKTYIGFCTAGAIARGEHGDSELVEVFLKADKKPHIAKRYAQQVENFKVTERQLKTQEVTRNISLQILRLKHDHDLTGSETISILRYLKKLVGDEIHRCELFDET